jgi:hypothetical protein
LEAGSGIMISPRLCALEEVEEQELGDQTLATLLGAQLLVYHQDLHEVAAFLKELL